MEYVHMIYQWYACICACICISTCICTCISFNKCMTRSLPLGWNRLRTFPKCRGSPSGNDSLTKDWGTCWCWSSDLVIRQWVPNRMVGNSGLLVHHSCYQQTIHEQMPLILHHMLAASRYQSVAITHRGLATLYLTHRANNQCWYMWHYLLRSLSVSTI